MENLPIAFLITFRTYGTWLHGDPRGSTSRFRNKYGTRHLPSEPTWLETNRQRLKRPPVRLTRAQRNVTEEAITETCEKRRWTLHALNARTNHVHSVVANGAKKGDGALNAFKANATRLLRERGLWKCDDSPWSDRGSKRNLWNRLSLANAIAYVLYGQGGNLDNGP